MPAMAGVAQRLRDVHRRQLDSGHGIAERASAIERPHASEQSRPTAQVDLGAILCERLHDEVVTIILA